ncbi:carbonic anhydrase 6-like [Zeugodacus cucurbitae]|uniref:carbonic anhydrase 6-like n=1 Tax=Zeugodacus cucurbitae TaxID=28588 RepID=UPI0023D8E8D4|nr:carbonic anhydrase 6-like [Zeugodacus cucurbitae]
MINRTYEPFAMGSFQDQPKIAELINNGDTIFLELQYDNGEPYISGGPLEGKFLLEHIYFHWLGNDTFESVNHTNSVFFPAELHLAFRNDKYPTYFEAARVNNGIAMLAYHYKVTEFDKNIYYEFMKALEDVIKPGAVAKIRGPLKLWDLISYDIHDYYTYTGTLTTMLCDEDVTWIEFNDPIEISENQVDIFRKLKAYDMSPMIYSQHHMLPLSNRTVFNAFILEDPDSGIPIYHSAVPFVDNLVGVAATWKPAEIQICIGIFSVLITTLITSARYIIA